jgi:hypothetical protein
MRIASNGNIGIGTSTIQSSYKLQVEGNIRINNTIVFNDLYRGGGADYACNKMSLFGSANTPTMNSSAGLGLSGDAFEYFCFTGHRWYTGTTGGTTYGTERMFINPNGNVVIGGNLNVGSLTNPSDSRIKKDIEDINDDTALNKVLLIQPKIYNYIDKERNKGFGKVYGFIAQQVRDVIPEAVSIQTSYIPNIYLVADYNSNVITLPSQPTKVVIKVNDKIKCYDKDNKELLVEVIEVIDDLTFRIKDIEYSDTEIFVYGTFVDDFHTLNKDYIFTLNVCATQELHRRIEAQSLLIKSHEDRIKDLETKMERMLSGTT